MTTTDSFQELILSYNEIQSDGGEAIAKTCSQLDALTTLDLDGNHFGDDGKTKITDILGTAKLPLLKPGIIQANNFLFTVRFCMPCFISCQLIYWD